MVDRSAGSLTRGDTLADFTQWLIWWEAPMRDMAWLEEDVHKAQYHFISLLPSALLIYYIQRVSVRMVWAKDPSELMANQLNSSPPSTVLLILLYSPPKLYAPVSTPWYIPKSPQNWTVYCVYFLFPYISFFSIHSIFCHKTIPAQAFLLKCLLLYLHFLYCNPLPILLQIFVHK